MAGKLTRPLAVVVIVVAIGVALFISRRSSKAPDVQSVESGVGGPPAPGGELVASVRSEPSSYNRYVDRTTVGEMVSLLTQAPLVRVNRTSDTLEPWLAERWAESPDHLTYTITLRQGIVFSDGTPFTSDDVLFSYRALYDPKVHSTLAGDTLVDGKPLKVEAPDPRTVIVRLPAPFAPGLRLLDDVPILPKHKLEAALAAGTFQEAWALKSPVTDLAGLGPFVLVEHVSGQRLVFARNPHYWRKDARGIPLPYLDKLTTIVASQPTEALKLQAGEIDLMVNGDIRPEDYAVFKRAADEHQLRLIDAGIGIDPNLLWFNLTDRYRVNPNSRWFRDRTFRLAISCALDRQAIVNTAYLGAAVPIYGPVTPGNQTWFADLRPACEHDRTRARELFAAAGLADRNADGILEDAAGKPVQFSILTQADSIRARVVAIIQQQLREAGIRVDVVALDANSLLARFEEGNYDSMYFGVQATATDPALNQGFWRSSGIFHFWNPAQKAPATDWERRIDDIMRRQATTSDLAERKRLFNEALLIFVEELPGIYLVAPKVTLAISSRVANPQPVPQLPQLLWSGENLAAAPR